MTGNSYPKRIAMLSVHTCPLAMLGGKKTGGMNVYVRDFSVELARRGVQVDVFTRSQDDCIPAISHELGFGARVIHIPAGPQKPIPVANIIEHLDEFVWPGFCVLQQEEQLHYDLIHSHYWLSGLVAEQLQREWPSAPIVHMFHTLGHMKNRVAGGDHERVPPERIAGEQHVPGDRRPYRRRHACRTGAVALALRSRTGKEIVIPPGVDLDRFHAIPKAQAKAEIGIPRDHKNIMFAGRIEPLKGIDTLLQAIALIQVRYPEAVENVCVAIIGGDPWSDNPDVEMARLQAMRTELGVHDMVTFLGAKDQNALPNYYAAAEMVIMPSHYESFGMVALEAMATGTPVIASEVGGLAFLIRDGENGFHVPSRDPEALAERIYELLANPACRDRLGHQARQYAQQYAWPKIVTRMLRVYDHLSREKPLDE